ncbi:MAG: 1,4-dihydroxy-2-naphthoate octaprenyltransferase [Akkermansiaceae bacterium]
MKSYLLAARPKTLPAAIVPVWIGVLVAYNLMDYWRPWLAFFTAMSAVWIQIATNFFNDAIDSDKGADTDARLGPVRATASGQLSRKTVYTAACVCLLLAAVFSLPLIQERGWILILIGLPSFYLSYGYTGGPLPLAYRGLGELFVILFFGIVAVTGTVFVQTGGWHLEGVIAGLAVGCLSAVLISINNLRDEDEDRSNHKNTLAVQWGRRSALVLLYTINLVSYLCLIFMVESWREALFFLPAILVGTIVLIKVTTTPAGTKYNQFLALSAIQLILYAIAYTFVST